MNVEMCTQSSSSTPSTSPPSSSPVIISSSNNRMMMMVVVVMMMMMMMMTMISIFYIAILTQQMPTQPHLCLNPPQMFLQLFFKSFQQKTKQKWRQNPHDDRNSLTISVLPAYLYRCTLRKTRPRSSAIGRNCVGSKVNLHFHGSHLGLCNTTMVYCVLFDVVCCYKMSYVVLYTDVT